ncbi:Integral membrane protein [plant metagenome]|uniref:Integral membrane protein n=1 Tax=plant metagenome TaxID=1297885 RepID=A0A484S9Y5_9ZZZZ
MSAAGRQHAIAALAHRAAWFHASRQLRRERADYYEYLAERMAAGVGGKTLLALFRGDAARRGNAPRARLSAEWARRCEASGGDLFEVWSGVFPEEDLLLLRTAQQAGAAALVQALRDLADATRLVEGARRTLRQTLAAGVVALCVLAGMLAAVPHYTAPRLWRTFQGVPLELHGPTAQAFQQFSVWLQAWLPACLSGLCIVLSGFVLSLPRHTGRVRTVLDRHAPWSLYRDFQGLRFLLLLALLLRPQGHRVIALRDALARVAGSSGVWVAWQAQRVGDRLDAGWAGADVFDTGLFDPELGGFLQDMIDAHGMDTGLRRATERLRTQALRRLSGQAQAWRWVLLLGALAGLLALAAWHYAVIDDLRRAMMIHHAGR